MREGQTRVVIVTGGRVGLYIGDQGAIYAPEAARNIARGLLHAADVAEGKAEPEPHKAYAKDGTLKP